MLGNDALASPKRTRNRPNKRYSLYTLVVTAAFLPNLQQRWEVTHCSHVIAVRHGSLGVATVGSPSTHASRRRATAAPGSPEASTSPAEPPSEAIATPPTQQVHELGDHGSVSPSSAEAASAPHPANVLALSLDCELATAEQ